MKRIQKQITILIIGVVLATTSCTSGFEDDNSNKTALTKEQQELDNKIYQIPLKIVQDGIYLQYSAVGDNWPFQIYQNLTADIFSGYMHPMKGDWFTNQPSNGWNDGWNMSYQYTYQSIAPALTQSLVINAEKPDFICITKILKVALLHRMADQYGPIIYTNYGINDTPDSLEDAYKAMFADLDAAITGLSAWIEANPGANPFTQDILTTDKTYGSWLKFANSLRLRLAMRVSFIDKTLAKTNIDKAMAFGKFLEAGATDYIASHGNYKNPLATLIAWGDCLANANIDMYMNGYEDPRRSKYFKMATDPEADKDGKYIAPALFPAAGQLKGVPPGGFITKDGVKAGVTDWRYQTYARPSTTTTTPAYLMTAAEVWFLRAEAALRGFTTAPTAEECYKKGVQASFDQWGAGNADAYLASENGPAEYKDQFDTTSDYKLTTTISPKWGGTKEENFERIAVQQWLAVFPEGMEGWAGQRRTGYPELMEVRNNLTAGIDGKLGYRRLLYPQAYVVIGQPTVYSQLIALLGGTNTGEIRLWWDPVVKTL